MLNLEIMKAGTNSAKNVVKTAAKAASFQPMYIEDPKVRDFANGFNLKPFSGWAFDAVHEIGLKLEGVNDEFIKDTIYRKIEQTQQRGVSFEARFNIDLLDVYHTVKQDYSPAGSDVNKFYAYLKKDVNPKSAAVIAEKSSPIQKFFSKIGLMKPKIKDLKLKESFDKARKWEVLKDFCAYYQDTKPEMTKYLYETYYLSTLGQDAADGCKKVANSFGTKIFLENSYNKKAPAAIYKEFCEWEKAGGDEVLYPNILDFSNIKQRYIDKNFAAGGFFSCNKDSTYAMNTSINLPGDSLDYIEHSIRHEMTHLNDEKFEHKHNRPNGQRKLKFKKSSFAKEMTDAGVDNVHYAHTNTSEFVACASQGDYSKYSDHFKKVLIRLGMPEWQFRMKPVKDMDYFG